MFQFAFLWWHMMLSIFSYAYLPSVYLLWWALQIFCSFLKWVFLLSCWILRVLCIFWIHDLYFANIFLNLCLAVSSSLWSLLFSCQFHFRKLLSRYTWGHIRHSSKKFATSLFVEAKWRGKKQCVGDYGTYNHRKLFSCFSEYEVFLHNC